MYIYIDISHVLDRRRAIDQLGASWSNSTVVDVGAGTGVLSVMCGKRAKKVMGTMGSGGETGEIEDFQQILSIVDRDVIARKKIETYMIISKMRLLNQKRWGIKKIGST